MDTWPKSYTFTPLIPVPRLREIAQELGLEGQALATFLTFDTVHIEAQIAETGEVKVLRCQGRGIPPGRPKAPH